MFVEYLPDEPDTCFAITSFYGTQLIPYTDASTHFLQVLSRSKLNSEAHHKAWEAYWALQADNNIIALDGVDRNVVLLQTPRKTGTDKGRVNYTFDVSITIENRR